MSSLAIHQSEVLPKTKTIKKVDSLEKELVAFLLMMEAFLTVYTD